MSAAHTNAPDKACADEVCRKSGARAKVVVALVGEGVVDVSILMAAVVKLAIVI